MVEGVDASGGEKVRENRLRRMARRQGYALVKSRSRDPRAMDYDRWMINDPDSNTVVAGELSSPRAMTADQVEAWLMSDTGRPRRRRRGAERARG